MITVTYLFETPLDPEKTALMIAGEQSAGTFVKVPGETSALRTEHGGRLLDWRVVGEYASPTLASAYLDRIGQTGPYRRIVARIAYPVANVGTNLTALAAIVAGNLFDLGDLTAIKVTDVKLPAGFRDNFQRPKQGLSGTRRLTGVEGRPILGTIIKPNIGMTPEATAELVETLCEAGVDFIKDDEINCNPPCAPFNERVSAVMDRVRRHRDKTGRNVMVAFNVSDTIDTMRRNADHIAKEGGDCAMVSLNWCGLASVESLRATTDLCLHGHKNGYGALGRHPALGLGSSVYQTLFRLTGIDHLHVHGMGGKFADSEQEVTEAAQSCLTPLGAPDDGVMPVLSSGQWAGTLPKTFQAIERPDFMFLAGGGILAHPGGPAAGVKSLHQAWEAIQADMDIASYAESKVELSDAIRQFS